MRSLNDEFSDLLNETFTELEVPGAIIGISIPGYETFIRTYGVADLLTGQPISENDHMRIGSITKTFTGTVLLQLVDEGLISLDDKLSKYFPDFPNSENITIEQLGNMRSGIFNYSEDENFQKELFNDLTKSFTPQEVVAIAEKHDPYFPPGTGMHYSNTNTILLGLIIEKLTGVTLENAVKSRILDPLGMNESVFAVNTDFPEPHAHGYLYPDSSSIVPDDVTNQNPSWGWSAGAMISTIKDVMVYSKALATGKLVTKSSQEQRLKWDTEFIPPNGAWKDMPLKYGFAIADFNGAIGHNGGIPGFNSFMGYMPEKEAVIVVLVNMQDNKAGIGPADFIARIITEKLKSM
ncbi:MAG: serine hydrolase domain-containing protein [Ignavibacteria bacterium]